MGRVFFPRRVLVLSERNLNSDLGDLLSHHNFIYFNYPQSSSMQTLISNLRWRKQKKIIWDGATSLDLVLSPI